MSDQEISVLFVEDSDDDVALLTRELRKGGFDPTIGRVQDAAGLLAALRATEWDIVISDHSMPRFDSFGALEIVRKERDDVPFIVVSGTVGEEVAVEVMKSGANDYLLKGSLIRLAPAVRRELAEAESRRRRRQAEEQLQQARKMESMGQLTGGVAHDFNNLLMVIMGNMELLDDQLGSGNPLVQATIRAASRGAELTQRLLVFSRRTQIMPQRVDLEPLIAGTLELLRRTIDEAIEIEVELAPELWTIEIVASQLENVILNLAINARDAMADGGKLTIECANVRLDEGALAQDPNVPAGEYVMFAVHDTGKGMANEVREKAFEPFFTTKGVGQGTGLGLSMVYGFAKQSGGHATIDSTVGRGTTVKLYLPRAEGEPATATSEASEASEDVPHGRGEAVLVIEDDPDVRSMVVLMLNDLSYRTVAVADVAAAREVLREGRPVDMILSDVQLPGGTSGRRFADEVHARDRDVKIVLMSGYMAEQASDPDERNAVAALLNKPFSRQVLAKTLREALDR